MVGDRDAVRIRVITVVADRDEAHRSQSRPETAVNALPLNVSQDRLGHPMTGHGQLEGIADRSRCRPERLLDTVAAEVIPALR